MIDCLFSTCRLTPAEFRQTLAVTAVRPGVGVGKGLVAEMWVTSLLIFTIHGSTNSARRPVYMNAIIIGMGVLVGASAGVGQLYRPLVDCIIKMRRPASAQLGKLLCPPDPGGPAAAGQGSPGSGGHNNFPSSAREGLLYFISPLLYRKTGLYVVLLENNCF